MNEDRKLHTADEAEIEALTDRTQKMVGRRKLLTVAATAVAFSIPASMISIVPTDALAVGSQAPDKQQTHYRRRRHYYRSLRRIRRRRSRWY